MGRSWFPEDGSGRGQDVGGVGFGDVWVVVFLCFKEEILPKTSEDFIGGFSL